MPRPAAAAAGSAPAASVLACGQGHFIALLENRPRARRSLALQIFLSLFRLRKTLWLRLALLQFHSVTTRACSTAPSVPLAAAFARGFCKLRPRGRGVGAQKMRDKWLLDVGSLEWVSSYLMGMLRQRKGS